MPKNARSRLMSLCVRWTIWPGYLLSGVIIVIGYLFWWCFFISCIKPWFNRNLILTITQPENNCAHHPTQPNHNHHPTPQIQCQQNLSFFSRKREFILIDCYNYRVRQFLAITNLFFLFFLGIANITKAYGI